ncbi:MAG TPA: glycerophosphodiester phosphodiesterase [Candidatus Dormibacteraeota bacterium]|nr:glycerophosphodiester phosphodiesterase [Candidatus Dormibacteraeota bacterium]
MIVSAHDGFPRWVNSGADFIEVDIRRTHEGAFVLSHDELKAGQRHTTLGEVLKATTGRMGVQLDLKEPGYELDVVRQALDEHPPERVVVTTPFMESIHTIKAAFPEVKAGLTRQFIEHADADFISLDQRYATEEALGFGMPVWIWTVDDQRQMWRLIRDQRVAGIITNRPKLALWIRTARL